MATIQLIVVRVILDICCGILAYLPWIILKTSVTPFKRGLFCDDESLKHPYKDSTVSSAVATSLSIIIPMVTIVVAEAMQALCCRKRHDAGRSLVSTTIPGHYDLHPFLINSYSLLAVFLFGAAVVESITNMGKYSVGRLRPHFFSICQPNITLSLCRDELGYERYVEDDVCMGTDQHRLKEMRLSFPSGHASITMYAAVFATIYLNRRMSVSGSKLAKHVIQFIFILLALATGFTRISDYKHHWSDVLAGSLLGATVAYLVLLHGSAILQDASTETTKQHSDIDVMSSETAITVSSANQKAQPNYRSVEQHTL